MPETPESLRKKFNEHVEGKGSLVVSLIREIKTSGRQDLAARIETVEKKRIEALRAFNAEMQGLRTDKAAAALANLIEQDKAFHKSLSAVAKKLGER
jgi:hypothetical protein